MDNKQYDDALTELCRALVGEMLDAYIAKLLADKENLINQMVSKMTPPVSDALRGTVHTDGEYDVPWHGKVNRAEVRVTGEEQLKHPHPMWEDYEELVSDLRAGKMLFRNNGQKVVFYKPCLTGIEPVSDNQHALCLALLDLAVAEIVTMRHSTAFGDAFEFQMVDKTTSRIDLYHRFPEVLQELRS